MTMQNKRYPVLVVLALAILVIGVWSEQYGADTEGTNNQTDRISDGDAATTADAGIHEESASNQHYSRYNANAAAGAVISSSEVPPQVISNSSTLLSRPKQEANQEAMMIANASAQQKNASSHFFFQKNPTVFVDNFESCIRDPECQVFYHHIQKASGTYIGSRLFPFMNKNFPHPMRSKMWERDREQMEGQPSVMNLDGAKWCCHEPLMERLRKKPENYCHYKFSTWEVSAAQMSQVIDICFGRQLAENNINSRRLLVEGSERIVRHDQPIHDTSNGSAHITSNLRRHTSEETASQEEQQYQNDQSSSLFRKAAVLVAYREPVARTVSLIHQLCNEPNDNDLRSEIVRGNWNTLQFSKDVSNIQEVIDACHRCSYSNVTNDDAPSMNSNITKSHEYKNDVEIWDHLVRDTINVLEGVGALVTSMSQKSASYGNSYGSTDSNTIRTFVVDVKDVTALFEQLQARFPAPRIVNGAVNSQKPFRVCHFDIDNAPQMVQKLAPGQELYAQLSNGITV
jgi:hypothetical protein